MPRCCQLTSWFMLFWQFPSIMLSCHRGSSTFAVESRRRHSLGVGPCFFWLLINIAIYLDMSGYHPMISPFLTYSRNSIEKHGLFLRLSNYHMIEKLSSSNSLALFIGNMDTAPNCEPLVHHWIATLSNIAMFGYLWISPFFTYTRMELYGFYILEKRWTSISQVSYQRPKHFCQA